MASENPDEVPTTPVEHAAPAPAPAATPAAEPQHRPWRLVVTIAAVALLLLVGIPFIRHALHTVSTDDAYVNSYVTFVAPRVSGQVSRVLVEDNNRVKRGDVLVELDPEPYQVQVSIKQAAIASAQADRRVFAFRCSGRRAGVSGALYEALGGRERGAHRGRVEAPQRRAGRTSGGH